MKTQNDEEVLVRLAPRVGHVTLEFVVDARQENSGYRNISSLYESPAAYLRVDAQYSIQDTPRILSDWQIVYQYHNLHEVDLSEAEIMVKCLRKIENGLTRLSASEGEAYDFLAYASRVLRVLGVRWALWESSVVTVGDFLNWTRSQIEERNK